jgi:hypothetical protein
MKGIKKTPNLHSTGVNLVFSKLTLVRRTLCTAVFRLCQSASSRARCCYPYCSSYYCGKQTALSNAKVIPLPFLTSSVTITIDHKHYTPVSSMKTKREIKCFDCGLPYSDPGFQDLLLPDWAWRKIAPRDSDGLLCPTCICRRLEEAKIKDCPSRFVSGSLKV